MKKRKADMKMKKRIITAALAALIAAAALTSCSARGSSADIGEAYNKISGEAPAESDGFQLASGSEQKSVADQKLIVRYTVAAEAKEYDNALSYLDKAVSEAGGYFEKRNEKSAYGKRDVRTLTAVIRIPADKADGFLTGVKGAVNVNSFSKTAENVTEAYIDAEARLQTLEAEREGLLNMISSVDSAAQYDFWYKLHEAISEKEQDIAALKARLRNYDSLVSYSTFELNLIEVKEYTEPEKETFGSRLKTAFIGSWVGFAEGFKDFAVGFVQAFPGLLTFAVISTVIFLSIFLPIRAARKKRAKR